MSFPAGAGNRIVAGTFSGTWAELAPLDVPSPAAVFVGSNLDAARAVWAHATTDRETLVAASSRAEPGLIAALRDHGLAIATVTEAGIEVIEATQPREAESGRIWLLTSGSTGRPKQVAHDLGSLTTVRTDQPARTWLCPYTPGAYAWWQVVTLGLSQPGQNVVFVENDNLDDWAGIALKHGVDAASGTPTFWRQSLMRAGDTLAHVQFKQITLGGEPVDQAILDLLTETFPEARVSWIYASSEAGAALAVHDGLAGFPEEWLTAEPREGRPRLSVDGDELVIASPHRGVGVDAQLRTGDRVEIRDGRVLITGRLSRDEINVGGAKVSAGHVREVLLSHPGIAWANVKGRRAPLVGTVVQAEVVLADGTVTEQELAQFCAERLSDYAVPRRFRFLDSIPLSESLKTDV